MEIQTKSFVDGQVWACSVVGTSGGVHKASMYPPSNSIWTSPSHLLINIPFLTLRPDRFYLYFFSLQRKIFATLLPQLQNRQHAVHQHPRLPPPLHRGCCQGRQQDQGCHRQEYLQGDGTIDQARVFGRKRDKVGRQDQEQRHKDCFHPG